VINENDFKIYHYNVLGLRSSFKGDLELQGDTIITSQIVGNVIMKDSGKLVLERGSKILGSIKAVDIEIFGVVEGDIEATGTVSVRSSAEITGTIKYGKLVIYPGSIIEGSSLPLE